MNEAIKLKNLRRIHQLTQSELGVILGIDQSYVSRLELSKDKLKMNQKDILIDYFNLEKDYFEKELNEDENKLNNFFRLKNKKPDNAIFRVMSKESLDFIPSHVTEKLACLVLDKCVSQNKLAEIVGVSSGKMSYIMRGMTLFKKEHAERIIKYFNLSSDYFEKEQPIKEEKEEEAVIKLEPIKEEVVKQTTIDDMMMNQLYKRWEQKKNEANIKLLQYKQLITQLECEIKNYSEFMQDIETMMPKG